MDDGTNPKVAKHRPSKFPTIEIKLRNWLEQATTSNQSLSDAMIRSKAKEFAHEVGYDDEKFKASSGWIENFKHRNNIKGGKWLNFGKTPFGMAYLLRQASPLHDDVDDDDDDEHFEDARDHMHNHSGLHLDDRNTPGPSGAPMHHHSMPSLSLQPAWPTPMTHPSHSQHSDVAELTDHYSSQGHHHHLDQHQEPHASHSHSQPHDDISMHPPTIDPQLDPPAVAIPVLIQDAPGMYIETHSGQQIYHSEGPRLPRAPTQPTLADAEEAMTTVITFLDTIGKGIVKQEDRNALYNVKVALFQAGSGVDFQGGR
ncbi:hypothetical protein ONZ45_g257 [Pleurotus djamor]|nr:hypothetical protein ONZ45_g257 [Pleurotus djamor]